jgi:hypothetical protein
MNRILISAALSVFITCGLCTAPAQGTGGSWALTADQNEITLKNFDPIEVKVYPPRNYGLNYIVDVFKERLPGRSTDITVLYNDNFWFNDNQLPIKLIHERVVQPDQKSYYSVRFQLDQTKTIKNGTYKFQVKETRYPMDDPATSSELFEINIFIDVIEKEVNESTLRFNFDCYEPYYGQYLKCEITPYRGGTGADLITGRFKVDYLYRYIGQNSWLKGKTFFADIENGVYFYPFKSTRPTELKVEVEFEGEKFTFRDVKISPMVKIQLSAPGSAIVGQNFLLQVRTQKNYSAQCITNPDLRFSLKNGVANVRMYLQTLWANNLIVVCKSNNWADSSASRVIYIRE